MIENAGFVLGTDEDALGVIATDFSADERRLTCVAWRSQYVC